MASSTNSNAQTIGKSIVNGSGSSAAEVMSGKGAEGMMRIIEIGADNKIMLKVMFQPFKVEIVDVDMILIFEDGTRIIVPGLGMAALSPNPPALIFVDKTLDMASLVAKVGIVKSVSDIPLIELSSADAADTKKKNSESENDGGIQTKDVSEQIATNQERNTEQKKFNDEQKRVIEKISVDSASAAPAGQPSTPTSKAPSPITDTKFPGEGQLTPSISIKLFNIAGISSSSKDGSNYIEGSTGGSGSDSDASYAAQSGAEKIGGTGSADVIYADKPELAPVGTSVRVLKIEAVLPQPGLTAKEVVIPSLPEGYGVAGATLTPKGWVLSVEDADLQVVPVAPGGNSNETTFSFEVKLQYIVPAADAKVNDSGFKAEFFFPVQLGLAGANGTTVSTVEVSARFGIKDVTAEADMTAVDPVSGKPVYVLFANPPATQIAAGDGDDKVIAGIAKDEIDGGSGFDVVSYELSQSAIDANLADSKGLGGYAAGDSYTNIEGIAGSDFDDKITGNDSNNWFLGGNGADAIDGRGGIDIANYAESDEAVDIHLDGVRSSGGSAEGDLLSNIEIIKATEFDDRLTGGTGDETFEAGAGDDIFFASLGADRFEAGDGIDTADYRTATGGVAVYLDGRSGVGAEAQGDVLNAVEKLFGSRFDDTLVGDDKDNILVGGAGADNIEGGAGQDTVDFSAATAAIAISLDGVAGMAGDGLGDRISGVEVAIGTDFDDVIQGSAGDDELVGGAGNDTLEGGLGADIIRGGDGRDTVSFAQGNEAVVISLDGSLVNSGAALGDTYFEIERVEGSNFDDIIIGAETADDLSGLAGDDLIIGGQGSDNIDGGDGFDTVDYVDSRFGVTARLDGERGNGGDADGDVLQNIERIVGSRADDRLIGGAGDDRLDARDGDDILVGNAGADVLDGGSGVDTALYVDATGAVTVALDGTDSSGAEAQGDTLFAIETLIGSNFNDTLAGSSLANTLRGGEGDDVLRGDLGADILDGGAGFDVADYSFGTVAVTVNLDGIDGIGGQAQGDRLTSVEAVIGTIFDDQLNGNSSDNQIDGGDGDDLLRGGGGADILRGGLGTDIASYAGAAPGLVVDLGTLGNNSGEAIGDSYDSIERILGSSNADTITGDAADNYFDGGNGDDVLTGLAGADTLIGGEGADTADYSGSAAAVTIALDGSAGAGGDAAGDRLSSIEFLTGSAFDDQLTGDSNANTLVGGAGDDILIGRLGSDRLDGGAGDDTANYALSTSAIVVDMSGGVSRGGESEGDVLVNVERVIGTDYADVIRGSASADELQGGLDNDVLEGRAGADIIDGGAGLDTADYSSSSQAVTVGLDGRVNSGGDAMGDVLVSIERLTGSAFADRLFGSADDDTLQGESGDDVLQGLAGADVLFGGSGTDRADYSASAAAVQVNTSGLASSGGDAAGDTLISIETVVGSNFNDQLIGSVTVESFYGGAGDDTLIGGGGADLMDGGAGFDTTSYGNSAIGVEVYLDGGISSGGDAAGDQLINIERLTGSLYDDRLSGSVFADIIDGSIGDDMVSGLGGNDDLSGGVGNDSLFGGTGADILRGGDGDDSLAGGTDADQILGGNGFDTADYSAATAAVRIGLDGSAGLAGDALGDTLSSVEQLFGSSFDDILSGSNLADVIEGGSGNDLISTGAGNDFLRGGAGDDILVGGAGSDDIDGGAGFDTTDYQGSASGISVSLDGSPGLGGDAIGDVLTSVEQVLGSGFDDIIIGSSAVETLRGGGGDDMLRGAGGADVLDGGAGIDTVDYVTSSGAVVINLEAATATGGDAAGDTLIGIERVIGSSGNDTITGRNSVNDTLEGGSGNDTLSGLSGNDMLLGGSGDDSLYGGAGADNLSGGTGFDIADYSGSTVAVQVGLDGSTGIGGDAAGDILSSIEALRGTVHNDQLTGSVSADTLEGSAGDDVLVGLVGDDILRGDAGDDVLLGGIGADILDGGTGNDIVDYATSSSAVSIALDGSLSTGGDAQGDQLLSIEQLSGSIYNDLLRGSSSAETIIGNAGDDTLFGLAGNDALQGGSGDDVIDGGAGADVMDGGSGTDTADYGSATGAVTITLGGGASGAEAQGDTLVNIERVTGSSFNDTLFGSALNDVLEGGVGDDLLRGNAGNDSLVGGAGYDTADYSNSTSAVSVFLNGSISTGGDASGDTLNSVERVVGSAYNDSLYGNTGNNQLEGGAGNDALLGSSGNDVLLGGDGDDNLTGEIGADQLDGGAGSDQVDYATSTSAVTAYLDGTAGSGGDAQGDIIANVEILLGSAYNDTLYGSAAADILDGHSGNDTLIGSGGNDVLRGNVGADVLVGGDGADILDGGADFDTADYSGSSAAVTVGLDGSAGVGGAAQGDSLINIEAISGSTFDDVLIGGSLGERLDGGIGNDRFVGSAGSDQIIGGAGTDTMDYSASGGGIGVALTGAAGFGGDAAGDTLVGVERVLGSAYVDTIGGSAGDDIIEGNGAADAISGAAGNDILLGGAGADMVSGDAGLDALDGGSGDDILIGGSDADTIDGGTGFDTADYSAAGAAVTARLDGIVSSGSDAQGDMLVNVERLVGSSFNDILFGATSADTLEGGDGDDRLMGSAGSDSYFGGAGTDTVDYSLSAGGVGIDLLTQTGFSGDALGNSFNSIERIIGSAFADTILGSNAADILNGGSGDDVIQGLGGADTLNGDAGNDIISGGSGADTIDGGIGLDTVDYSLSASSVAVVLGGVSTGGDAAGDTLANIEALVGTGLDDSLTGDALDNILMGSGGDDLLFGLAGSDILQGGAGLDTLNGGAGADSLDGGAGIDIATYATSSSAVNIGLDGSLGVGGDAAGDVLVSIEQLEGSSFADILRGNASTETLSGGGGDDILFGSTSADMLDGGAGIDTVDYTLSASAVTSYLDGTIGAGGQAAGDSLTSIERLSGSAFNDTLIGSANVDILEGNGGDDILRGADNNDSLIGGAGNDVLEGGAGADSLSGGTGTDTATYALSAAAVAVDLLSGTGSAADALGDTLSSVEIVIGSGFNDSLSGSAGDDQLIGGSGNDLLVGRGGADILDGGANVDTVDYSASSAAVTIALTGASGSGGDAAGDQLINIERLIGSNLDDDLAGSGNADYLEGGLGADTLRGGAGDDELWGMDGSDTLIGGLGADRFEGGAGFNTADYSAASSGITVGFGGITGTAGEATGDQLFNIQRIIGTAFVDTIFGNVAASTTELGAGNDIFIAATGAETLNGGAGTDTADYSLATSGVQISLDGTVGTGAYAAGDTLVAFERLVGSAFDDTLSGFTSNDTLEGGAGNDSLTGAAGDDQLLGNDGNDLFLGDLGADTIDGGVGIDVVDYALSAAAITAYLDGTSGSGGLADADRLIAVERIIGSSFADTLYGHNQSETLEGGAGADTLFGANGNDSLLGGAGDDMLRGDGGADTLDGGADYDTVTYANSSAVMINLTTNVNSDGDAAGDVISNVERVIGSLQGDTLTGSAANDVLEGNDGNDTLSGLGGVDNLLGGSGDDNIRTGLGADIVDGGTGIDTVDYSNNSVSAITVVLNGTAASGEEAQGDVLSNVEAIIGTNFNDSITGASGAIHESFFGGGGNDSLVGNAGNDILSGDAGDDTLIGGIGSDTLSGGTGADTADYTAATGALTIFLDGSSGTGAEAGGDNLTGIEIVQGGNFGDIITGTNSNESLYGNGGNDTLISGGGTNIIDGGIGTDTASYAIYGNAITVNMSTNSVSDGATLNDSLANIERVIGTTQNDIFFGSAGADTSEGNDGNDLFYGSAGADTLRGDVGVDTVDYTASSAAVQAYLNGTLSSGGDAASDDLQTIENIYASSQNDTLVGSNTANQLYGQGGNDSLSGEAGNDQLYGGAGNDVISGGAGADTIDGGTDIDTADYTLSNAINLNLTTGVHTGGDAAGDTLTSIERVVGSLQGDTITGSALADVIEGNDGNDSLFGNAGNDTLSGGIGDDVITSGVGSDIIDGGAGIDIVDYSVNNSAGVTVYLDGTAGVGADAAGDTLVNVEEVRGTSLNDVFSGAGQDEIFRGNGGDDLFYASLGADQYVGGTGVDTVTYAASTGLVRVYTDGSFGIGSLAAGDRLTDIETVIGSAHSDEIYGSSAAETLDGGLGNDRLDGGSGNDVLLGNDGDDLLLGGDGADQFNGGTGTDTAYYFNATAAVDVGFGITGAAGEAIGDVLTNIEFIEGSNYNDTLRDVGVGGSLSGGVGNDLFYSNAAITVMNGGIGTDTVDYASSTAAITVALATGGLGGFAQGDSYVSIETVIGTNFADTLTGDVFGETLNGGAGDDILRGGIGADSLVGGTGVDTATYASSTAGVTVYFTATASSGGEAEGDMLSGIERVIGSGLNDVIYGSVLGEEVQAGDGDDVLHGSGGADILNAGNGTFDYVSYETSTVGLTINLANSAGSTGDALNDSYAGVENYRGTIFNDVFTGTILADRLFGNFGDDSINGGDGDDLVNGDDGNDTLLGSTGNDYLDGGFNTDTVSYAGSSSGVAAYLDGTVGAGGDAAGDTIVFVENLIGSAYADNLIGSNSNNSLTGGDGDDLIYGAGGADAIDGGNGFDTASYSGSGAVTVRLDGSVGVGNQAAGDTLLSIERVIGSGNADFIYGATGDDTLEGSSGNDYLSGGSGADTLRGDTGDDILAGGAGADILDGGGGSTEDTADYSLSVAAVQVDLQAATATGGDAAGDTFISIEYLTGSVGADTLGGSAVSNYIVGGDGNDTIFGYGANDNLNGGNGDDIIDGGVGADTMDGGAGSDTLSYVGSTNVNVNLGTGTGTLGDANGDIFISFENVTGGAGVDILYGSVAANVIIGGDGGDTLYGVAGNDTLQGGTGDDFINPGDGTDVVDGGAGIDTLFFGYYSNFVVDATASGVTVYLDGVTASSGGHAQGDIYSNIEIVYLSQFADTVFGTAANETFVTLGGADTINASGGFDTVQYNTDASAIAGIAIGLDGAVGTGGDAAGDRLFGVEQLTATDYDDVIWGSGGNDVLYALAGADTLRGDAGADTLDGGSGIDTVSYSASALAVTVNLGAGTASGGDAAGDTLVSIENVTGSTHNDSLVGNSSDNALLGGNGDDTLVGGSGADLLNGGNGFDTVDYSASASGISIAVDGAFATGGDAEGDQLLFVESVIGTASADTITGSTGAETLVGGNGDDILTGGAGADTIQGGSGDDQIIGGADADTIDGGSGTDTASYATSSVGVTVYNDGVTLGTGGDAAGDRVSNVEYIVGSNFDDALTGSSSADQLSGGSGDDILDGGAGADTLSGGSGTDYVSFATAGAGISVDASSGLVITAAHAVGDSMSLIEGVIGSGFNDSFIGGAATDFFRGGGGDDGFVGSAGADLMDGGTGTDTVDYSGSGMGVAINLGAGTASGGDAAGDTLTNIESIIGSANADTLTGATGSQSLSGGVGDDILSGLAGDDSLNGGNGDDLISGGSGNDMIDGGNNNDTLILTGNWSDYTISYSAGTQIYTIIDTRGGAPDGIDSAIRVESFQFADGTLNAFDALNDAPNALSWASGGAVDENSSNGMTVGVVQATDPDTLDSLSYSLINNAGGRFAFNIGTRAITVLDGSLLDYETLTSHIITLRVTDSKGLTADLNLTVSLNDVTGQTFTSTAAAETFTGGAEADIFRYNGASGSDTLVGGGGTDRVQGFGGGTTDFQVTSNFGNLSSIEEINGTGTTFNIVGTSSDDVLNFATGPALTNIASLNGGDGNDTITGTGSIDTIYGGIGDDTLNGGGGNDLLIGGAGSDAFEGGSGTDTVSYAGAGAITLDFATPGNSAGDAAGDSFSSIETIIGTTFNDSFTVGSQFYDISGGGGASDRVSFSDNSWNEAQILSSLQAVDELDFTSSGVDTSFAFDASDVQSLVGNGNSSVLNVFSNAGDAISINATAGTYDTNTSTPGVTIYTFYNDTSYTTQLGQLVVNG
jgi:Ca2+-binding RTX toxin-like protein